jgi:diguanylate cyclase (GGDEF)-like protein/PAS domain S-box-containing protein
VQIFSFLSFLAFIIYLRLGLQVYQADRQQRVNRLFLALTLSLAIWSLGYIFIYYHLDDATAQFWFWNKFSAFGWVTYSGFALHLSLELTRKERFLRNSWAYMLIYGPGMVALAAELALFGPAYHPLYAKNLFALLHGIYYGSCIAASLILVWRWGRKTYLRREKKQAKLIVFSGLISFVSGFVIHTIIPFWGIREIPPSGQITTLIWAWGVTQAISKYKLLNLSALISADKILTEVTDLIFLLNTEKRIIRVNRRTEEVLNFNSSELEGEPFQKLITDCTKPKKNFDGFLNIGEEAMRVEVQLLAKSGESIPIDLYPTNVRDNLGDIAGLLLIGQDIRSFKKLEYLSFHDPLTGLYNRLFFEQEMQRLENRTDESVGIILSDIDGLKLINDTFGHVTGDKLILTGGQTIERVVGSLGIAARVGGDEIAVLLKGIKEGQIQDIYRKIKSEAVVFKEGNIDISLSLSVGYAYSEGAVDIRNLFKEADDNMYREKLFKSNSIRSAIIRTLTETLQARDYITEGHAKRLQDTVNAMGKTMKLPESSLRDLQLFAQFHDIGKVGIPDRILFKSGPLTLEEKKEMQRHSEIGYRIAVSSPELLPIADWILKHHEWWDGSGYPIGLKMEKIPLACRILAIADAYDAMTSDRPYSLAMSEEKAVSELLNGAGTQFDPTLVQVFLAVFPQYTRAVEVGA